MRFLKQAFQLSIGGIVWLCALSSGCSSLPHLSDGIRLASLSNPPDEFRRGTISKSESAAACIEIAETFEESGHLDAAATQYERARNQDPRQIEYAPRLAVLYARLERHADARREFKLAIAESPKDIDLKNDYAYFLTQAGDVTEGEKILREILDTDPSHTRARVNLGINLAYQDRLAEAHEVFATAIGPSSAHHNIGVILTKRGKHAEAAVAFQQAKTP